MGYVDFKEFINYEFDCGSEWTRAWCLDTCELDGNFKFKF